MAHTNSDNTESSQEEKDETSHAENLIETAKKRFQLAVDAESEIRTAALEDLRFSIGEQWPENIKADRETQRRPTLTINRLPQFIRQVTNDQRQNRPSIKVSPVDNGADPDSAKVRQGLIRHIEYSSNADVAYDVAFDGAVRKGLGYFRITTEYCDPLSFDQDIKIKAVPDSFLVYLDPFSQEPDGSDANWGFVFEDVNEDDYKAQYPGTKLTKESDWSSLGDTSGWIKEKSARIAEYFYKEFKSVKIFQMSDGSVVRDDDEAGKQMAAANMLQIKNERTAMLPVVHWAKINGLEVLDEKEWAGSYIPIIPVYGDRIFIDGKKVLEGIVRHAKDPQRMLNYWESAKTETIALAPKAPWIIAGSQIKGYEKMWETANTENYSALIYNAQSLNNTPLPPPQRNSYEPPVQAMTMALRESGEHLKETTGVYDAAMGAKSNETSGVAIQRRSQQAQTSNFHFVDNLSRSLRHAGRIILELIPKIYDTERAVRIIGEDDSEEIKIVNQIVDPETNGPGINLSSGKYDIIVQTGPSYATKRQEAAEHMLEFIKVFPAAAQVVGDLVAKNLDFPGAGDFQERLKAMVPPEYIKDKKKPEVDPEMQAQLQQMQQMVDQLTEQLNLKTSQIETKTLELESKERIEMAKLQVVVETKLAELGAKEGMFALQQEIAQIENRLNLLNQNQPIQNQNQGAGPSEPMAPEQVQEQQPAGGFSPGGMEY